MTAELIDQPRELKRKRPAPSLGPPPLRSGDRLSRAEFEWRYQAHPEIKKAELIEGVVYVASPIHLQKHADPHFDIIGWLAAYRAATPGVKGSDNATLRLDFENEPQPDALLRLETAVGGRSHVTDDDYLEGAPELIVEIAASSASYDLHDKRRAYGRNGVQEYLVWQTYEQAVVWFALREGVYEPLQPDEKGILRSEIFPGLWLLPKALWENDLAALLAVLQEGLQSPEHAAFVQKLQK
ncbi:MAG TPA: Uma2 family endonuclease [Anaerolineae bacterium]|nr:Uma2 family endonuclease [Anaerolineae bacterium]HIP71873.1 Uma2 family endonuclease [Anaerolineae bacterium]